MTWAIISETSLCLERATHLAQQLQLPILLPSDLQPEYILAVTPDGLEVRLKNTKPISVDFLAPGFLRRLHSITAREPLLRAVGLKKNIPLNILDVTAGFGIDACILAYAGAHVTLLEREPIMGLLLQDGLARAKAQGELMSVAARMHCEIVDAKDYLSALTEKNYPDVIYLDPMFVHPKSALPNKQMQFLQHLSDDSDADQLLNLALKCAHKRVVIKRSINAPYLAGLKPDMSIKSKLLRFDVFL
ncbi:MAG: class I SAM-dependent methyltransferase [Gammaproteobacteria bacterium]|jgi:16S rRNA (guanine1516-N2)-methyltransferase